MIAGDLFDTALPSIDILKSTAKILNRLKDFDIPIYIIPGSHDFSASGKTMLDVLENAGLVHNVMKFNNNKLDFTVDRTGVKLAGMFGRKGGLETYDYANLDKSNLESEPGFKIFLFHTLWRSLRIIVLRRLNLNLFLFFLKALITMLAVILILYIQNIMRIMRLCSDSFFCEYLKQEAVRDASVNDMSFGNPVLKHFMHA